MVAGRQGVSGPPDSPSAPGLPPAAVSGTIPSDTARLQTATDARRDWEIDNQTEQYHSYMM